MKAILSTRIIALFSTALAGCWTYSRTDLDTSCEKTSYGLAIVWVSTEDCGVDAVPTNGGLPAIPGPASTETTARAGR
jgi:hypothetical protein